MNWFGGQPKDGSKKASFSLAEVETRGAASGPRASGAPGAKRPTITKGVTLMNFMPGKNLSALVDDVNTGKRPNIQLLREKHLDAESVIDSNQLKTVKVLGEGAFGVVYKCSYAPRIGSSTEELVHGAGGFVAVKKLKVKLPVVDDGNPMAPRPPVLSAEELATINDRELSDFASELLMLKSLKHPNVIGYVGCTLQKDKDGNDQLAIVQEYAPHGTLKTLVMSDSMLRKQYTTADGLRWAHHIAAGMAFLHDCKPPIIHRDLKPENILLCGDRATAKIADFGLVTFEKRDVRNENFKMTGMVGSMRYMAPENYRGEDYSHKNDVYSFAIICYELLMRQRAYDGLFMSTEEIAKRAGHDELRPAMPAVWPEEAKSLHARCWAHEPAKRPGFKEISTELASWRNDYALTVLKGIVKGSKRGLLERVGFSNAMLNTSFSDSAASAASKRSGGGSGSKGASFSGRQNSLTRAIAD